MMRCNMYEDEGALALSSSRRRECVVVLSFVTDAVHYSLFAFDAAAAVEVVVDECSGVKNKQIEHKYTQRTEHLLAINSLMHFSPLCIACNI